MTPARTLHTARFLAMLLAWLFTAPSVQAGDALGEPAVPMVAVEAAAPGLSLADGAGWSAEKAIVGRALTLAPRPRGAESTYFAGQGLTAGGVVGILVGVGVTGAGAVTAIVGLLVAAASLGEDTTVLTAGLVTMVAGITTVTVSLVVATVGAVITVAALQKLGERAPYTGAVVAGTGLAAFLGAGALQVAQEEQSGPLTALMVAGGVAVPVGLIVQIASASRAYRRYRSGTEIGFAPAQVSRSPGLALHGRF